MTVRFILFGALWGVLGGLRLADLPGLVIGAGAATAASLTLLPPTGQRLRLFPSLRIVARFLRQSVIGGFEVGVLALHPRRRLRPCIVTYDPKSLPQGGARNVLRALTSAVPGVMVCGEAPDGALALHCLDGDTPVASAMAADERLLLRASGAVP